MVADNAGINYGGTVGQSVTTRLGGKWTPEKQRFFTAWAKAEGTQAQFNPFATTRRGYQGETQFNSVGVKNYPSLAIGMQASYDTLTNGYYNHIVDLLKNDNATAEDLAKAVANSPWGTGTGVLRVLGADPQSYEQAQVHTKAVMKATTEKITTQLQSQQDAATYGKLSGEAARIMQSIDLTPSASYLDNLRKRGGFAANMADIAEKTSSDFSLLRTQMSVPQVSADDPASATPTPEDGQPVFKATSTPPGAKNIPTLAAFIQETKGTPYSWAGGGSGGASFGQGRGANTKGFDCSGLVQYYYAKLGKQIPRVTYDQWQAGQAVDNPSPGDLVFFHPGSRGPEHVGLYLGNGKYLQAPQTGDVVKVSKMSDRSDYMGARTY